MYAEQNLKSACWQTSTNPYKIIYINDCSPDKTGEIIEKYVAEHSLADKVKIVMMKDLGAVLQIYIMLFITM